MSLTSLPTELIEHIAVHFDLLTFRSVRLTCTSLSRQTLHAFIDHFFRTRILEWTKESFERLLKITAHACFGQALRTLIIDASPRHSISLWQLRRRISEVKACSTDANGVVFKSDLQEQYVAEEKAAKQISAFFNETRYDQKCLVTIFTKLGKLDSIIFGYEAMEARLVSHSSKFCEANQHEMSRPFVCTLAAIASSNIRVKSISIDPAKQHGAVSIGRLESLASSLRNFDTAFEKLEVLKLNLRDWRNPDIGFQLHDGRPPFIVRFLAKARNVKNLQLSCHSRLDGNILGAMARNCSFTKLEICFLSLFQINRMSDLIEFLRPSRSTLQQLYFKYLILQDHERNWADLLQSMILPEQELTSLRQLHLSHLVRRNQMGHIYFEPPTGIQVSNITFGNSEGPAGLWRRELEAMLEYYGEWTGNPMFYAGSHLFPFEHVPNAFFPSG